MWVLRDNKLVFVDISEDKLDDKKILTLGENFEYYTLIKTPSGHFTFMRNYARLYGYHETIGDAIVEALNKGCDVTIDYKSISWKKNNEKEKSTRKE